MIRKVLRMTPLATSDRVLRSGVDGANLYRNRFRFGANEFFA